jgi:hypothetical protein
MSRTLAPDPILSDADHAFFRENGYVVVRNAVPRENLQAVIDLIWSFLGMDPNDPEDWYREPHRTGGMVEVYQAQALWDNRQHPRIHQIFSEILGTERLWVSLDRACMKPPYHRAHPEYDHRGFIHWDADTTQLPVEFGVQGVLCLTDTAANQGGFQCVPELFRCFDRWVRTQPKDRHPRVPDLSGFRIKPVAAKAGDLIVWHRLLAHGNGHNVSRRPRLAQYITMYPAQEADEEQRQQRIDLWRNRRHPDGPGFVGDPRRVEEHHYPTAELTPLGRKLLGLDPWDSD